MPSPTDVQTIIDEAIAEVLEASIPRLRAAIQESSSQADILRRLLEGAARFAGRAALFVVKAKSIAGWQALGFADNDCLKTFALDTGTGLVAQAIQSRAPASGPAREFDEGFVAKVAAPAGENCVVLPLVVKLKVAAIVYADAGTEAGGGRWA